MKKLPLIFILILLCSSLLAQEDNRYVCITLQNGIQRCGYIVKDDGREITLNTPSIGTVIIPKADIINLIETEEGLVGQNSGNSAVLDRVSDPTKSIQPSRYFFAPSAFSMNKNEGYGTFALLTGGNVSYGISNDAIIGMSATYLGAGFNFKRTLKLNSNTYASFGGMFQIGWADSSPIYFPFINLTKGTETRNITLNLAYLGRRESNWNDPVNSPMINVSATTSISNRLSLITENYYFVNPEFFPVNTVLSFGMRHYGSRKNRLTDFAMMVLLEENGNSIPLPWLSWTWPF